MLPRRTPSTTSQWAQREVALVNLDRTVTSCRPAIRDAGGGRYGVCCSDITLRVCWTTVCWRIGVNRGHTTGALGGVSK
jgi:hypothetical protein